MINLRTFGIFCCVVLAIMLTALLAPSVHSNHDGPPAACWCNGPNELPWTMEVEMHGVWEDAAVTALRRWNTYADVFRWRSADGYDGWNTWGWDYNEILFMWNDEYQRHFGMIWGNAGGVTYARGLAGLATIIGDPNDPNAACEYDTRPLCLFDTRETEVLINPYLDWKTSPPSAGVLYNFIGSILLHELGHVLGRLHSFEHLTTMNYIPDYAQRYLTLVDVRALRSWLRRRGEGHRIRNVTDLATYPFLHNGGYKKAGIQGARMVRQGKSDTFRLQNITVENIGTRTLSDVRLKIYLSRNDYITESDYLIEELRWDSFSTWWEGKTETLRISNDVPPGYYYIGAIIFYNTDQTDSISYNNTWVLPSSERIRVIEVADYCLFFGPCPAGRGDCDSNRECQDGLTCVNDVGARYGLPAHYDVCEAGDPDYCVSNSCGIGDGDCDPGQCDEGVCVNDVGARYGLPAHYDVCEAGGSRPDPDYCVSNSCGIGDGDCDPGQCDEGVCVNDVGARYGLPAHYDVCEAGDPDYCVSNSCGIGDGDCDPGQCDEGVCVNDVGARYGLPAHYDVCEAGDPDYCVSNSCGIGDGDCDPGQCDEGVCVNDVGARYGLPAHYDVCEAGGGG